MRGVNSKTVAFVAASAALASLTAMYSLGLSWLMWPCLALGALAVLAAARALSEKRDGKGWAKLILFGAVMLLASGVAVGAWLARGRAVGIVRPMRTIASRLPSSVGITNYRPVQFNTADGLTLRGWYVPPVNGAVVVFVHGHAGNRDGLLDDAAFITQAGYGALLFDLRNSGESDGDLTTLGLLEVNDVRAAVAFVMSQPDVRQVALLGHSMGGATALMAGADIEEVSAVIAGSAYTSLEDNIRNGVEQVARLPAFPFAPLVIYFGQQEAGLDITEVRPIDSIARIAPRPVLLVHGQWDETIPVQNAHDLYEAAREPKLLYIIDNVGHCCFVNAQPVEYPTTVLAFLQQHLFATK